MLSLFHARLKKTLVFYVGLSIIYLIMPGYFFYNSSVVLPIFYYADLDRGDKDFSSNFYVLIVFLYNTYLVFRTSV